MRFETPLHARLNATGRSGVRMGRAFAALTCFALLFLASPSAFAEIARAQVLDGHTWTPPVLANGRIYCRNDAGAIACVDVRGD